MPRNKHDEVSWLDEIFAALVSDVDVERHAWELASSMVGEDDPAVYPQDVVAARGYLKACLRRMSEAELGTLSPRAAACLWARGALGAARYRTGQTGPGAGPPRGRGPR